LTMLRAVSSNAARNRHVARSFGSSFHGFNNNNNHNNKYHLETVAKHEIQSQSRFKIQQQQQRQQQQQSIRQFSSSWNWSKTLGDAFNTDAQESDKNNINSNNNIIENDYDYSQSINPEIQAKIQTKCKELHSSIMPLNEKIHGPLARQSDRGTSLPFVFLVGNHSSGKSSFVNYVIGRKVQTAGVAPTDDCFTVIAPGPEDTDQDGPALIGDPDMGFGQLRQFGPTLIHHTALKVRRDVKNRGFMMVDSPGMIDSPVSSGGMAMASARDSKDIVDRGYDFQGVVRWFAERADIVLLFFDPDKPGTTGETLSVLLHSLGGMDHKLLIVLNKADQFKKIHDFARAYGSLCWNLSKVIPRKDLPRIFTMCLPVDNNSSSASSTSTSSSSISSQDGQKQQSSQSPSPSVESISDSSLYDLHQSRDDVVQEVLKAPKRRMDNVITHLHDSTHQLLMHARIAEDVRSKHAKLKWEHTLREIGTGTTGMALVALGIYIQAPVEFAVGAAVATALGTGGMKYIHSKGLKEAEERFLTEEELGASFRRTHAREIAEADEFIASVWARIRESLRMGLLSVGLDDFPKVREGDIQDLERILDEEIPELRRMASPQHFGSYK